MCAMLSTHKWVCLGRREYRARNSDFCYKYSSCKYPYTDLKLPLNVCASASSTTFSLLKLTVNHRPFMKLWNTLSDILERGKMEAEDWVQRGKLELKYNWCPCQWHRVMPQVMCQVSNTAQKWPGTSQNQKHLLGRRETFRQAFLCYSCKQLVRLCPSPGNPGRAGAEGGLHLLCTGQVKRSEAGEAMATGYKK